MAVARIWPPQGQVCLLMCFKSFDNMVLHALGTLAVPSVGVCGPLYLVVPVADSRCQVTGMAGIHMGWPCGVPEEEEQYHPKNARMCLSNVFLTAETAS